MTAGRKETIIAGVAGIIPVTWLALKLAPYCEEGLFAAFARLDEIFDKPFSIELCPDSLRMILILNLIYIMGIGIYISMQKNYRRGEEHGSARWGDASQVNRKYEAKPASENKLLTQNVRIGLDGRKHRRNLNVLVIGGSGAGKTRFYCKPNLMQANTSFVILDPKGQLKCERALNLPLKFTYFRERRWQKWLNLRLYGILPSTSDSLKMMNLKVNLTVFPIRKST